MARALPNTQGRGGYAGIRVGEAENPGPATYDRDCTGTEQSNASLWRINEAGDSVPNSQDSVTRGVQNLRISVSLAEPAALQPHHRQQWGIPDRHDRNNSPRSTFAVHSAVQILPLTWHPRMEVSCSLWGKDTEDRCCFRTACATCCGLRPIGSRRCRRCNLGGTGTPLRELRVGDTFQNRRQPGHQNAAASGTTGQKLPQSSPPALPGEPVDDSPLPKCPIRDVPLSERDTLLLTELRQAPVVATAWAESLEGAVSSHQFWALLCHYRCHLLFAAIPKGVDRNSQLKQRLHLWEVGHITDLISKVLGQQSSGPFRRTPKTVQPQSDEQRGKRSCALSARGSISKAMKGLVGGAAQGSADCRLNWTTALIPRSSGIGTHPSSAECVEAARIARGGGRCKLARGPMRAQGRSKRGFAWLAHVKLSPMSALGPTGERQEHLDANCLLRRSWHRRRLFRCLDILTIKRATGD